MLTLVLGGIRSGKSEHAEELARWSSETVTYIATACPTEGDDNFSRRIERHQARRPASWHTVEAPVNLVTLIQSLEGTVLVDSLGTWVSGHTDFAVDGDSLATVLAGRTDDTIVVSDEVGLSVHPPTAVGRAFCDALGLLNQQVAAVADSVVLVIAGRALTIA